VSHDDFPAYHQEKVIGSIQLRRFEIRFTNNVIPSRKVRFVGPHAFLGSHRVQFCTRTTFDRISSNAIIATFSRRKLVAYPFGGRTEVNRTVPSNEPSHERKKGDDCDYFFRSKKKTPLWKCLFCVVADVISCCFAFTEHGKNGDGRQPEVTISAVFVKKRSLFRGYDLGFYFL